MQRGGPANQTRSRQGAALRGFTLLELMLALALSGIVLIAATSMFWVVFNADKSLSARFSDQVELAATHRVLQRAMGTMVAAKPEEPPPEGQEVTEDAEGGEDREDGEGDSGMTPQERAAREKLATLVADLGGDSSLAESVLTAGLYQYTNFELYFELKESGRTMPRLQLTLMREPVAPPLRPDEAAHVAVTGDQILGSFDLLEEGETFTLIWQPIDPPGMPTVLKDKLLWVEWYVLPRKKYGLEWVDVYAAYIEERFPVAVRLLLWTESGMHTDWLFATEVTTPN